MPQHTDNMYFRYIFLYIFPLIINKRWWAILSYCIEIFFGNMLIYVLKKYVTLFCVRFMYTQKSLRSGNLVKSLGSIVQSVYERCIKLNKLWALCVTNLIKKNIVLALSELCGLLVSSLWWSPVPELSEHLHWTSPPHILNPLSSP